MRTTVTLDSSLINGLQQATGARTKARAVVTAIQNYLRRHQMGKIKRLKGKMSFKLSADQIRHAQR